VARTQGQGKSSSDDPIRILHLSDFHFSAKRCWDSDSVLARLTEAIAEMVSGGLAPDVVAITGDIAHKGCAEDYEQARRWIDDKLRPVLPRRFPPDRILIVPGNHDVDREAVNLTARAVQSELSVGVDQDAIAEVLQDPEQRDVLLKRHNAYMDFANALRKAADALDVPWWSTTLKLRGQRVHVAGLCSSWTSWCDEDDAKLLVGRWQVNELLKGSNSADWSVALLHHPWASLVPSDAEEVEAEVHRRCHVVLRGHLHRQRSRAIYDPGDVCLELAAGSAYAGSRYPNAFQLVTLHPDQHRVDVHFWLWRDGRWIPDRNAYPQLRDNVATFLLDVPPAAAAPAVQARPVDIGNYLRSLRERTAYIDIRGLQVGSGRANRFLIDELYIPLTTSAPARDKDPKRDTVRDLRVELDEALENRRLVIVGDPGAGKTTFLCRIANLLCRALMGDDPAARRRLRLDGKPFPILIRLAELAEHIEGCRRRDNGPVPADSPAWLPHFLATTSEESGAGLDESFFREQLQGGSAMVLLDGLDEAASERQRKLLASLVQKASRDAYGKCRFVLTSRPAAYQGEAVLPDFAHARIDALEPEAIETFLTRWCEALFADSPAQLRGHLRELLVALRRPEIRRMARNPVMLTALAVVHWNEKRLPEQRADLYESIILWLARSREDRPGRPPPERCVALHQELALAMQDHPDGRQMQVPRYWAGTAIARESRDEPEHERVRLADAFLRQDELDSGIVVGRGDHVRFWHLTFQEYLAARAMGSRSEDEQRGLLFAQPQKLYEPQWRETVLLLAGVLHHQGVRRVDAMFSAILDGLDQDASLADQARCFGLLGAAVRDLGPVNYKPADRRYQRVADEVMGIFDAERSRSVDIKVAIAAAEALGQAGDPRLTDRALDANWVDIPAGDFLMGAQRDDSSQPNYNPEAYPDESPVHKVRLAAYRIARYPVTVAEYARFVEDGGYANEQHWQAGGFGERQEPDEWAEQLAHPNRPVTGVNWFEAAAYAAWAGCRLPSEAEWERAARGTDGRRYPWGNHEPTPSLANYGLEVGCPTPVGVYPRGGTPDGILDLAGNVWEWCQDAWRDNYDGAPIDGSAWTKGGAEAGRVLRGGSWVSNPYYCRSALRGDAGPDYRNYLSGGFRCAAGTH